MERWFYFRTREFEIRSRIFGALILTMFFTACASDGPIGLGHPSERSHSPEAIVLVRTEGQWLSDSIRLAKALQSALKRRNINSRLYIRTSIDSHAAPMPFRPQLTNSFLREAWEDYYALRFASAWTRMDDHVDAIHFGSQEWIEESVLRALIRYAQGRKTEARGYLVEGLSVWSGLALSSEAFPPRFVRFFDQIKRHRSFAALSDQPLTLNPRAKLSVLHNRVRRMSAFFGWDKVWVVRVVHQGDVRKADVDRMGDKRLRRFQSESVRYKSGESLDSVANRLVAQF